MILTDEEELVLVWAIADESNETIGKEIGRSSGSVGTSIKPRIYKKLGANRLEVATVQAVKRKAIKRVKCKRPILTFKQRKILEGIAIGKSQVTIGFEIGLNPMQFKDELKELKALFKVQTTPQLMLMAASCNLV